MNIRYLATLLFLVIETSSVFLTPCSAMHRRENENIVSINNNNIIQDLTVHDQKENKENHINTYKHKEQLKSKRNVRWSEQQKKASAHRQRRAQKELTFWREQAHEENVKQAEYHIPLCIFLDDQSEKESPQEPTIYAISQNVVEALATKTMPMIISNSLLHNFIHRKYHQANQDKLSNISLLSREWDIYRIPNTQLFLVLPKGLSQQQKSYFKTEYLEDLTLLFPAQDEANAYKEILEKILTYTDLPEVEANNFKLIFNDKKNEDLHPIWDIFITGHGNDGYVADLSTQTFNDLLLYFNNNLTVGVLIISSCYAGGVNLQDALTKIDCNDDAVECHLHFPLIVASVGDIATSGHLNIESIMLHAKQLKKFDQQALNELLKALHTTTSNIKSPHASTTIPQIVFPKNLKLQSLYPEDDIAVIGNVLTQKHECEKRPIITYEKTVRDKTGVLTNLTKNNVKNILLYSKKINVPLHIKPIFDQDNAVSLINITLKNIPDAQQLINQVSKSTWRDKKNGLKQWLDFANENIESLSHLHAYAHDAHNNQSKNKQGPLGCFKEKSSKLFPAILSMIHGDAIHQVEHIILDDENGNIAQGKILDFIRHSLLSQTSRESLKFILIDKLSGKNDINLTLEALRVINRSTSLHPLETPLQRLYGSYPGTIMLKKVIIRTKGNVDPETLQAQGEFLIRFMLEDDSAWKLIDTTKNPLKSLWDIQSVNTQEHLKIFEELEHIN